MTNLEDYENFKKNHQSRKVYDVKSLLSVGETMQFYQEQTMGDRALNVAKSVYNGAAGIARGTLRGLQAIRDTTELEMNRLNPDRMQMDEDFREALDSAADAEMLKPYEVRADSGAEQFVYDLAQGAGQLTGQAAISLLPGGAVLSPAAMALQIGGEEYRSLREQGVDVETAGRAAAFNAAVQTPLESIGLSRIMRRLPANTLLWQRVRHTAENALTEGITEFLQEFPERASEIWALEHKGETPKDAAEMAAEIAKTAFDHFGEIAPGAAYSGVIGGFLGGGASGLHIAADRALGGHIERAMQREAHNAMMEHANETANRIKESGINPQYAAIVTNDNTQNATVYVDGMTLQGYAQEAGMEKVAESLGVTVEEIEKAAANGDTVDVKLGNFEATGAAFDGFFQAVQDDTAFEDGGYTPNKEKYEREILKQAKEQDDEFRAAQDELIGEIRRAGAKNEEAIHATAILSAWARNQENPLEALKSVPRYVFGGDGRAAGLAQAAMYPNPAKSFGEFYSNIMSGKSGSSYFNVKSGEATIRVPGESLRHMENEGHHLTPDEIETVLAKHLGNITMATHVPGRRGQYGHPVAIKITTPEKTYGVVIHFAENGRIFYKDAFYSTENNIVNNWLFKQKGSVEIKKGAAVRRSPSEDSLLSEDSPATSDSHPFSVSNIQEQLGIVNEKEQQRYHQEVASQKEEVRKKYEGTDQWMKAPNGEPTNLTEDQWLTVRTEAFKNWFGDWENDPKNASKVVDENGEPLVVYHGTDAEFDVFDASKTRANMDIQGNFFSPWKEDAQGYGENVRAFFLNIKKPANSSTGYKALNTYKGQNGAGIKARESLKKQGFDGVNNDDEEYIAFEPTQIKSATDNNGQFDAGDPNIYHQFAGENAETADKMKLAEAERMEAEGKAPDEIYKATGWFKGLDGKWRFEIPDNLDKIDLSELENGREDAFGYSLGRIYDNPALYEAYPWLAEIPVVKASDMLMTTQAAVTNKYGTLAIELNANRMDDARIKNSLVHEIQHLIQMHEGFAAGGSTETVRDQILAEIRRLVRSENMTSNEMTKYASLMYRFEQLSALSGHEEEWAESLVEISKYEKTLPKEKREIIQREYRRKKELSKAYDSKESDDSLYYRLGGEQEARKAAARANGHTRYAKVKKRLADAEFAFQKLRESLPEAERAQVEEYLAARDEARKASREEARHEGMEDEEQYTQARKAAWDKESDLEAALPENVLEALQEISNAEWSLSFGKEALEELPKPHESDALIVFGGEEMPYSQNVDNPGGNGDNSRGSDIVDERTAREIEREKPAVRQQYEGTPGWMKAPNGKDTNLTEEQWLAARTKAFKSEYGDWEYIADAYPEIIAKERKDVVGVVKNLQGKTLKSTQENIEAKFSHRGLGKLYSDAAVNKSKDNGFSIEDHFTAVANIEKLFANSIKSNEREDENRDIEAIEHYSSLFMAKNNPALATFTVKVTNNAGRKIYSIELMELKKVEGKVLGTALKKHTSKHPQATSTFDVLNISQIAEKYNSVKIPLDENGEPIFSDSPNTPEENKKDVVVSTEPVPGTPAYGPPSIPTSFGNQNIPRDRGNVNEKTNNVKANESRSDNQGGFSDGQVFEQAAWHGSPHTFQSFDLGAIGTGEGAQAHGWGLYFAQDRKIAEGYKERLQMEGPGRITVDGDVYEYYEGSWENKTRYQYLTEPQYRLLEIIAECNGDKGKIRERINDELKDDNGVYAEALEYFEDMEEIKFEEATPGALFQVEIPDDDVLLDKRKKLSQQSKTVREGIKKAFAEVGLHYGDVIRGYRPDAFNEDDISGLEAYLILSNALSDHEWGEDNKAASLLLNKHGIKGLIYDGRQDGTCFVVFDDKAIEIINAYNKKVNGEVKGNYNPETNIITLFKGADASTVIHETWHFFVEQMWRSVEDGSASAQTAKDFDTLLSYAGMTREAWAASDANGRRAAHEKLAEAGETYIMEGKAPSMELRGVFEKFAQWLKDVYRTISRSGNAEELTDEVREVFDRMLAAEDDIARMERVNGYFAKLPPVITEGMSDATKRRVEDFIEKARGKAVDILTRRALRNYTKEKRETVKNIRAEMKPKIEEEVAKRPVYACGFDKADAKRYRALKEKETRSESAKSLIDRTFQTEEEKDIAKGVAKSAAEASPGSLADGLRRVRERYERLAKDIIAPAIAALESGMGQGVDIVQSENGGRGTRVSNNAEWYREFYKEHKRRPNKAELREMARLLVSGDVNAPKVEGWMPRSSEQAQDMKAEGERLADLERRIKAADAMQKELDETGGAMTDEQAAFLLEAELTAEQYGYSGADEMMKDVESAPPKSEAVSRRVREMTEELSDDGGMEGREEAIRESIYNEDEALLIAAEQWIIESYAAKARERQEAQEQRKAETKARRRERQEQQKAETAAEREARKAQEKQDFKASAEMAAALRQQARNVAKADLAKMNIFEATRTSRFVAAERRAAMRSAELLAKEKYAEAAQQKNLQAYWHAMAAESINIKRRKEQYEKFIKTQTRLKKESWLNDTHFAAVSQLFARMGIAGQEHREAAEGARFKNLAEYAEKMSERFDCVDIADWILEETMDISDTKALTLDQYEDVVNAIKNIKAIVKAQKGVNMFSTGEAFAGMKQKILGLLKPLPVRFRPNPNKPTRPTAMEKWQASMENTDTLFEMMDDSSYGFFSKVWGNVIKRAADHEYECLEKYNKADADALKKWLPDKTAEAAAGEEVFYEELGTSVTKHTLVKMLINLGNADNAQRLCETVPVGFEKNSLWIFPDDEGSRYAAMEMTRQNLIHFLGRVLTKEDVEYAQRKIDAAEMFWGEKNDLEKRVKGFGLKKVQPTPVLLRINGENVILKGGYFPLMRNGETGSHSVAGEVRDDEELQGRRIRTYHTDTSATKKRTQARYPVNLFPGAETQWIYESIHDLCWREAMSDFRHVLNDQELFSMMKSRLGIARMNNFKELLEVCADPMNSKSYAEGERALGEAASWLRQRMSHAVIMCNLKVVMQNYANAFLYGNAVEGYTMADNLRALGRHMLAYHWPGTHRETVEFVTSKSAFMRERMALPDITVRDIVGENKEYAWEKVSREMGVRIMALTDNATAMPNWIEAYNKKLNEGATEQEAIDFADTIIRRVLGSSRITDVSSMQRGGPLMKLLTMFQSFFNARWNEFIRTERAASKQWAKGEKQEAFAMMFSYAVSKWLGSIMLSMALALQNPFGIDDEDDYPELLKEMKSYTGSMLGFYGQIGSFVVGKALNMHEYNYRISAVESTVDRAGRALGKVWSKNATTAEKAEGILDVAGTMYGVPAQFNRIFWNLYDAIFNGMDLEWGDIYRRRPKKERK